MQEMRDTREFGIEGYAASLVMSVELLLDELYATDPKNTNTSMAGINAPGMGMLARLVADFVPKQRLELRRSLPQFDPIEAVAWESCAVVGNSGSVLLQELGEEIDAHDMVMRFNGAPTLGYEAQASESRPCAAWSPR